MDRSVLPEYEREDCDVLLPIVTEELLSLSR